MTETALLPSVTAVVLPQRLRVDFHIHGIHVRQLDTAQESVPATVEPYRSRGATFRRALIKIADGRQIILELTGATEAYEAPISGVVRARSVLVEGGALRFEEGQYRTAPLELADFRNNRDAVLASWSTGIRYRPEL